MQKNLFQIIKENLKRTYAFNRLMRKHFYSLLFLFALNIGFILYAASAPREPSLQIFIAIWLVSAVILIKLFYTLYSENNAVNLPLDFDCEVKIRSAPLHEIKAPLTFIGNIHMRGFSCRIYIYSDEIMVRFHKRCLIIKNSKQVEINKFLFGYLAEFKIDEKFVQCSLNRQKAELLEEWLKNHKSV